MLPNYHPKAVVEQLLEGAHLSSEDHVAALLRWAYSPTFLRICVPTHLLTHTLAYLPPAVGSLTHRLAYLHTHSIQRD